MARMVWAAVALAAFPGPANADRTSSPIDTLSGWAIQSSVFVGGGVDERLLVDGGTYRMVDVEHSGPVLRVRVWPLAGTYLGLQQGIDDFDETTQMRLGADKRGLTDLGAALGHVQRMSPSLAGGGGLRLTLPTGSEFHSQELTDVEVHLLLGFSFTPRWDFSLRPRFGHRAGTDHPRAGSRAGFDVTATYQRIRLFVDLYGFNLWHFEEADYRSAGAGYGLGFELGRGLTLGLVGEFAVTDRHPVAGMSSRAYRRIQGGLQLEWVFHPTGKPNQLRREDPTRGRDWTWWRKPPPT